MPTRTLFRLTLLAGLAAPLCAFALGVGPLAVRSALNQNFQADIPLIVSNPGELNGLTVRIPRQQDFDQAGVERLALLAKLRFAVETPPGGPNLIRISSTEPIREPNFNLLLEVLWSRGRLIREFTVQVDPELYADRQPPPPPLPPPVSPPPIKAPVAAASAPPRPALELPPAPPVSFEGASLYGPVRPGETLLGIADRVRPSSDVNLRQMMSILLAGNPGAFAGGNPNALRRGAVLKVPAAQALGAQGAPPPPASAAATPAPSLTEPSAAAPPSLASASPDVKPPTVPPLAAPPLTAPPLAAAPPLTAPGVTGTPPLNAPPSILSPTEPPKEIVPQATIPQPESASAGSTAPAASSASKPPVAAEAPTPAPAPPPAVKPPVQPVVEPEGSWLDNPLVWLALALIGLAIAAVLLLPLLRRSARTESVAPSVDSPTRPISEPASAPTTVVTKGSAEPLTQPQLREAELTRPLPPNIEGSATPVEAAKASAAAVAAMAAAAPRPAPHPQSVTELLKEIDFGIDEPVPAFGGNRPLPTPTLNLDEARLPDAEPVTASATRKPTGRVTEPPPAQLDPNRPPATELPSELRLDGFDFDLGDLGMQQTGSQSVELPPLEMKPGAPGRGALSPPSAIDMHEPATEPASRRSFASILAVPAVVDKQTIPTVPTGPGPSLDKGFDFSDVTQELGKSGNEISLRLDEKSLPDFGNQPIELGKTAAAPPRDAMDTTDYVETKLDLATAYLDMGDQVGARGLLEEVLSEGDASQKQRATDLLKKIG
ncbi:MAG TPA: FimV/HubP family polar landmark protein [Candidatus Competibacter sp.]|nr:hypothetical protein [Candidatus Competibacteraceae bacterium]HRC71274.1 FimV/HubP family polar landmark protein [Candidatus Competibacter sp.]